MALKKMHFGRDRLRPYIEENYGNQSEFAARVGRSQPTVARWCGKANFADREDVKESLRKLEQFGVNPEYFWNPLVTDWKQPVKNNVGELEYRDLVRQLELTRLERDKAIAELSNLRTLLEECMKEDPHAD